VAHDTPGVVGDLQETWHHRWLEYFDGGRQILKLGYFTLALRQSQPMEYLPARRLGRQLADHEGELLQLIGGSFARLRPGSHVFKAWHGSAGFDP
jgi:hypothetical protein